MQSDDMQLRKCSATSLMNAKDIDAAKCFSSWGCLTARRVSPPRRPVSEGHLSDPRQGGADEAWRNMPTSLSADIDVYIATMSSTTSGENPGSSMIEVA